MFAVLIGQIEHLDSSSVRSYCVGQVYVTNEIIQFNEQKFIDKIRCEWCFNAIPPANSMYFCVCSIFCLLLICLPHKQGSSTDVVCFASADHTNINRLSTTPI